MGRQGFAPYMAKGRREATPRFNSEQTESNRPYYHHR